METPEGGNGQTGMVPGGLSHAEAQEVIAAIRRLRSFRTRQWVIVILILIQTIVLGLYAGILIGWIGAHPRFSGFNRDILFAFQGAICGGQLTAVGFWFVWLCQLWKEKATDQLIVKLAGADEASP